jgi:apolipoprotein N-acyltransferase
MTDRRAHHGSARVISALVSALLLRATMPVFDVAPLIFIAWIPLLVVAASSRPGTAFRVGSLQGFVLGLLAHAWLVGALLRNFPTPTWGAALALVAVALLVAVRSAAVMAGVAFLSGASVPLWLSFPVLQVAAEQLLPGAFPWTNALSVSSTPIWQQAAAFGGTSAVSAWLCLVNGLLAEAWLQRATAAPRARSELIRLLVASLLVVGAMSALGAWLMRAETERASAAPKIRVAIAHYDSATAAAEPVETLRALALAAQRAHQHPDLWLWPETALGTPQTLQRLTALESDYLRRDRALPGAETVEGPLLLGAVTDHQGILENSAVLFTAGGIVGSYSKQQLMPIGETSTLFAGLSLPAASLRRAAPFRAGSDSSPISLAGHSLAVSICYEDTLADFVFAQASRNPAELLVNLTSDRWFKGTSAVDFHFALARLRAVEHRQFSIRSTRDGVSAAVDSAGRVIASAAGAPSRIFEVSVPLLRGRSIAVAAHRGLGVLTLFLAATLLLFGLARRRTAKPHFK